MKRMQGKRVLVTGAGRGIGKGVAVEFAKEGADVAFHYNDPQQSVEAGVEEAKKQGVRADSFLADFNDLDQVGDLVEKSQEFLGGIDVLINNAGITVEVPFDQVSVEDFDPLFAVNLRAMYFLTQAVVPIMTKQGEGSIVNLSSILARFATAGTSVYSATKAGIEAFTRSVAMELIRKGIRVNAIAPGCILVERYHENWSPNELEKMTQSIPTGHFGTPEDVGRLAIFLASPESRFMVGQTLVLDGGQSCYFPGTHPFGEGRE